MYDLAPFTLKAMTECGVRLRGLGTGAGSMEEAAARIVHFLYEELGRYGERACLLVRFYKTHAYGELEPGLQVVARGFLPGDPPTPETPCLTLLATAGDEPAWNSRHQSSAHKVIPLPSEEMLERLPMVARLVSQLGVDAGTLLQPDPGLILDMQQRTFNVFYVPDALGSPYIPAQREFVVPFGVKSVLGFGGVLPTGDLFSVILFARVRIPPATAELFRPLSLSAKLAILPFAWGPVFAPVAAKA